MRISTSGIARVLMLSGIAFPCAPFAVAQSEHRSTSLLDLGVEVGLSSPEISPDGRHIVVVASHANYADNRFERALVLIDSATGAQRVLPGAHSGPGSPQWSPDGDRLAWLDTEEGGEPQIYVMPVSENSAQPLRITNTVAGVKNNWRGSESFAWSPDGSSIAFITAEPPEERKGEERHNRSFEVTDNDYLAREAPPSFNLWVVPAGGGKARRLTSGVESVTGIGWVQHGQSIVMASQPHPHNSNLDFAEFMGASSRTTALKTINVASGAARVIVSTARILSAPTASPSGDLIAYERFRGPDPWTYPHGLAVIRAEGSEPQDVTKSLDRDVEEFAWLPDSKALLATAPEGTRLALWMLMLEGAPKRLELGSIPHLGGLTVSTTGVMAFVGSESRLPAELYVKDAADAPPRRLTHFNDALAARDLGRSETIKWQLDGFEQSGVLIYPPGFSAGQKYPLVLNIHGGPEGTSTEAFDLFGQILAAHGWVVFKPNYRGSNSQGGKYESAVINDLGDGPGRDVMAGLAAVKARGFVDEHRIAVSGWSYGGYMTAWLIGHYGGWSSAVTGAPLTNLLDWYSLSCCSAWADPVVSGSPWLKNNFANYWRFSPITYADKIHTPTLILQNMGDPEVPYTGSYSFYHALRDNGVPVKFVVYPVQGHGYNGDPVHQRDTLRRWITWIDEHFAAPTPGRP